MSPGAAFVAAFVVTLGLLGAVVASGLAGRRRLHLALVVAALAALAITVREAYPLGEIYDLEAAGWITPVHMFLARAATASYVLPITTGILTWRDARRKKWHRACAVVTLGLTVLAAATGTVMIASAPERAPARLL